MKRRVQGCPNFNPDKTDKEIHDDFSKACDLLTPVAGEQESTVIEKENLEIRNITGRGLDRGLMVLVDIIKCGWISSSSFSGLKLQTHSWHEFPVVRQAGTAIHAGMESFISVTPAATITTGEAAAYHVTQRECILPNEVELEQYPVYTQRNCMLEKYARKSSGKMWLPAFLPLGLRHVLQL